MFNHTAVFCLQLSVQFLFWHLLSLQYILHEFIFVSNIENKYKYRIILEIKN